MKLSLLLTAGALLFSAEGFAQTGGRLSLKPNEKMTLGEKYFTEDGRFYVTFPSDGNLKTHLAAGDKYRAGLSDMLRQNGAWKRAKNAMLGADGNLVLTDAQGNQVWSTNVQVADPPMQLIFSDDGDLQLRRSSGEIVWSMSGKRLSPSLRQASVLPQGPRAITPEEQAILDRHNEVRALHGAQPLSWSPVLAAEARQWANTCGPMKHATDTKESGENLAAFSTEDMPSRVQAWYDEVKSYDYNNPGFNKSGSSQEKQTGHFTQVVWSATAELGCAKQLCPTSPFPGWLVCRYFPAGNYNDAGESNEASAFRRNVRPISNTAITSVKPTGPVVLPPPTTKPAAVDRLPLRAGTTIAQGQKYLSESGKHYLIFQPDGNVVVYDATDRYQWGLQAVTPKYGQIKEVQVQPDGNFAVYGPNHAHIWSALTKNPDPSGYLNLAPDGALRLVSGNSGATLWASDNNLTPVSPAAGGGNSPVPPPPAPPAAGPVQLERNKQYAIRQSDDTFSYVQYTASRGEGAQFSPCPQPSSQARIEVSFNEISKVMRVEDALAKGLLGLNQPCNVNAVPFYK